MNNEKHKIKYFKDQIYLQLNRRISRNIKILEKDIIFYTQILNNFTFIYIIIIMY